MNLEEKLATLNKTALVSYVMIGDPDLKTSYDITKTLLTSGTDVIELGMPFSDPAADGKVIQEAGQRALKNGVSIPDCLKLSKKINKDFPDKPIILMGYFNPILNYGTVKFLKDCDNVVGSGLIIVDLPYEEMLNYPEFFDSKVALINLITPLTVGARLKSILARAKGFLYYISVFGITGTQKPNLANVNKQVAKLKKLTKKKVAVGFGIKSKAQITELGKTANLAVIGSAYCKIIADNSSNKKQLLAKLKEFNSKLK